MGKVPIPETVKGWAVAALITVLAFAGYYLYYFQSVNDFYYGRLYRAEPLPRMADIQIRLNAPRYFAIFGTRWVYFTLQNRGETTKEVWVSLSLEGKEDSAIHDWNLPFLFGTSALIQRSLHIELPPNGSVSGRLPIFGRGDLIATLQVAGVNEKFPSKKTFLILQNPGRSLAHSFVEQILLPPWSNGFLLFAVFVICTLVENRNSSRIIHPWLSFWKMFYASAVLLLFLGGSLLVLVSLPWWSDLGKGKYYTIASMILFIFVFLSLTLDIIGVENPLKPLWQRIKPYAGHLLQFLRARVGRVSSLFHPLLRFLTHLPELKQSLASPIPWLLLLLLLLLRNTPPLLFPLTGITRLGLVLYVLNLFLEIYWREHGSSNNNLHPT